MIVGGRVRGFDDDTGRFVVQLDGAAAADLTDVDLLCVSTDLSNPFTVVGKVEAVTGDDTGAMVAGHLLHPDRKAVIDRRTRGLLKGRRCSRFEVSGRVLRPVHTDLIELRDPYGQVIGGAMGVDSPGDRP
ncbi:hypothetical protein MX572_23015 (plasmid) [Rhodococcus pyridinivorans]|uniref:hypothetical protein n=1 Tax=Rhodococcus pyridinivorans TaxID=103816 RepID=UPI0020C5F1B5|nr:hypothetical protein [Rhodococcus pyridinivorans]UTM39660.1 hypothetical protein MX572_23015 [Rhodococcus pyridinivorans]